MKILLLNNNPVVNKLVTLSVQKTSDELSTAGSTEAIEPKDYDVLILDDALYSEDAMAEIESKIKYKESLYICAKDAKTADGFSKTLRKPFLPTDLVEMLISLSKMVDTVKLDKVCETHDFCELEEPHGNSGSLDEMDDFEGFEGLDELDDLDGLDELEDLDEKPEPKKAAKELEIEGTDDLDDLEDDGSLDDLESLDKLDEETAEELELDEFEDLENLEDDETEVEGILDKDELQEVQNLLEETEMEEEFNFDESGLELENIEETNEQESEAEETLDEDLSFHEHEFEKESTEEELGLDDSDLAFDEDLELGDDLELDEDTEFGDDLELQEEEVLEKPKAKEESSDELEDLASQIQSAVQSLSDEDLQTEVDEDLLLNIGSLTSRDLKLAIGEELNDEEETAEELDELEPIDELEEQFDEDELEDELTEDEFTVDDEQVENEKEQESGNEGVEALKKLLKALSNEDVAASLKGMKININITLGDK
jgi:uncharacterized membrane protein